MASNPCEEYAQLLEHKAELIRKLGKANRMKELWPDVFGKEGKAEMFTTQLGGTGTVPFTMGYWLECCENKSKKEITLEQWNYITRD